MKWLEENDDPFGLNDYVTMIISKCIDCGEEDEIPDYVVKEFHYDIQENEEVGVVFPYCNRNMRRAWKDPSD